MIFSKIYERSKNMIEGKGSTVLAASLIAADAY